jgi:hypothetical protein
MQNRNRACPRRGANTAPHCSRARVWATATMLRMPHVSAAGRQQLAGVLPGQLPGPAAFHGIAHVSGRTALASNGLWAWETGKHPGSQLLRLA